MFKIALQLGISLHDLQMSTLKRPHVSLFAILFQEKDVYEKHVDAVKSMQLEKCKSKTFKKLEVIEIVIEVFL